MKKRKKFFFTAMFISEICGFRIKTANGKFPVCSILPIRSKAFDEYDFLAVGVLMIQGQGDLQREFFRFYGYENSEINENLRKRLMLLTMFYEWSDLRRYAIRLREEALDYSLLELEKAIWNFCYFQFAFEN